MRVRGRGGDAAGGSGSPGVFQAGVSSELASSREPSGCHQHVAAGQRHEHMPLRSGGSRSTRPPLGSVWGMYVGRRPGVMVLPDHLRGTTRVIRPKASVTPGDPAAVVCPVSMVTSVWPFSPSPALSGSRVPEVLFALVKASVYGCKHPRACACARCLCRQIPAVAMM